MQVITSVNGIEDFSSMPTMSRWHTVKDLVANLAVNQGFQIEALEWNMNAETLAKRVRALISKWKKATSNTHQTHRIIQNGRTVFVKRESNRNY